MAGSGIMSDSGPDRGGGPPRRERAFTRWIFRLMLVLFVLILTTGHPQNASGSPGTIGGIGGIGSMEGEDDGLSSLEMTPILVFFVIASAALWFILAAWTYNDSRGRGMKAGRWFLLVLFFNIFGLVVYLAYTKKESNRYRQFALDAIPTARPFVPADTPGPGGPSPSVGPPDTHDHSVGSDPTSQGQRQAQPHSHHPRRHQPPDGDISPPHRPPHDPDPPGHPSRQVPPLTSPPPTHSDHHHGNDTIETTGRGVAGDDAVPGEIRTQGHEGDVPRGSETGGEREQGQEEKEREGMSPGRENGMPEAPKRPDPDGDDIDVVRPDPDDEQP